MGSKCFYDRIEPISLSGPNLGKHCPRYRISLRISVANVQITNLWDSSTSKVIARDPVALLDGCRG